MDFQKKRMFFTALILFILLPFSPNGTTIQAVVSEPLNGSYTINSDGTGDFLSLKEAADTYNNLGLDGNSIFVISSDLVETTTVEFKGSAPNSTLYTLTITSDNTVQRKVSGTVNGTLIKLIAANNLIINGMAPVSENIPIAPLLAFTNMYAPAGSSIRTLSIEKDGTNSGQYVRILNAEFSLGTQQAAPGGGTIIDCSTDSLWINNCYIHSGHTGINGTSNKFIQIHDNIVSENHASGIYTVPFTAAVKVSIIRNVVKDMNPTTGSRQRLYGIYVEHNAGSGTCDVSYNKVDNLNNQAGFECSTNVIYIYSAATIKVIGNKVSNIYNNSTSTGFALQGIYIFANTTNGSNTIQCLNDTVINLSSESYASAISINCYAIGTPLSLAKNCLVNNIAGKGIRPNLYNSVGIYASGPVNMDANKIDNIKNSADNALASAIGIFLNKGTSSTGFVSNNTVSDVAGRVGIGIIAVGTLNLYHNSIRMTNKLKDTDEATLVDLGDRTTQRVSSNILIQNNLLSHEVATGASQNFVLKRQSASGTSTIITNMTNSNNRYYVVNGNIAMIVSDATAQAGTIYTNLTDWTTATGDNSLMAMQPAFKGTEDLHLTAFPYSLQVPLISGITTDFDGDIRASCGNTAGADVNPSGQGPLSGTYRIGNAPTDDFSNLKQAADIYNSCGLSANTIFMITSDLTETATAEFKGSAPNSTLYKLTVTTDNTVRRSVSGAINGPLVKLSGANNITFDGIIPATEANPIAPLLAFINTYTTASANIRTLEAGLENTSHGSGVHLLNTDFALAQRTTAGGTVLNYLVNFLHTEGCYIHDGNLGINSTTGNNLQIANNIVANTTQYGIFITPLNPANVTITGNVVKDMTATASSTRMYGIRVYNTAGTGTWTISENKVSNMLNQSTAGTTVDGISIDGTATIKVNKNLISGLTNNGTSVTLGLAGINILSRNTAKLEVLNDTVNMLSAGMQSIGIYVNNVNTASPALVKNCYTSDIISSGTRVDGYNAVGIFISSAVNPDACTVTNIKSSTGSAVGIYSESKSLGNVSNCMVSDVAGVVGIGIHVVGPANIGIFHNTVRLTSKLNDSHEATAINIGSRTSTTGTMNTIQLRNNLFSNEVPNGATQNFIIKLQPLGAIQSTIQFDNRYNVVNGNIGVKVTNITAQTGNVYPTLSAWSTFSGDNSTLFTPAFAGATDLHLTDFPLSVMAPFIASVATDFDGEVRAQCSNAAGADNNPNISTVLNGIYTIGSQASANFKSLKQAADIYNNCGLSGNTTFKIISDLTETATVEFKGTTPGSDAWTLTITSDNSPHKISGNINGSLIQFTAANNITIDGGVAADTALIDRGNNNTLLIFNNIYPGDVTTLKIQQSSPNDGKNLVIRNATFSTNSITGNNKGIDISSSQSVNEISGCYFTNTAFGINMLEVFKGNYMFNIFRTMGKYGIVNQVNTLTANMDLRITGNDINHITYTAGEANLAGIAVLAEGATGALSIDSNKIAGIANNYLTGNAENITARGIRVNFSGNLSCSNNTITNITSAYGSYTQGILINIYGAGNALIDSCNIDNIDGSKQIVGIFANARSINARYYINANSIDQVESSGLTANHYSIGICADGTGIVEGNKISNVISARYYAFGIQTQWTSGNNTDYLLVANNMIRDIKAKLGYGVYADQTLLKQKIFQNTIVLNGAGITGTQTTNIGYSITASNDYQIKNNILVNTDLTGTAQLYIGSSADIPVFSDNKYTTSAGIPIGTLGGTTYNNLTDWNAATDDQSVLANPTFVSPTDLHLAGLSLTDDTLLAPYLPEVISDIDSDPRSPCKNTAGADNTDMGFTIKKTSVINSICPGDSSLMITTTEVGGKAPYKYSMDGGLNFYNVEDVSYNVLTINPENPIPDGTYYLTIRDSNDCEATDTSLLVIKNPIQRFATITGNQIVCENTPATFEDATIQEGDKDFVWSVDGGSVIGSNDSAKVTILWTSAGDKAITLSYNTEDGCRVTSDTFQILVPELPEAIFWPTSSEYSTCEGNSMKLEISFTGSTPWNFTYNDGNNNTSIEGITTNSYFIIVKPIKTTTYTIIKTSDSNGCINLNRDSVTVVVAPGPRADFSFSVIDNNPFNYQFTDKSTITSGTISSWEWDFGDGNFSSAQNPTHIYKDKGVYEVLLRIRSSYGCASDTMKTVEIIRTDSVTIADFTINNSIQCFTQNNFQFTNTSVIAPPNQLIGYMWNFGDGQTSTLENPLHHYTERGTYVVELIVIGTSTSDTTKKTVRIYEPIVEKPADQIVCNANQTQEVVFKGFANLYTWTGGASIGLPDGSDTARIEPFVAINNTTTPVTNTIYIIPIFNLLTNNFICHGEPVSFQITVNPVLQPSISGDSVACTGVPATYVTEAGMNNYNWEITGGNIISGGSTSDNNITILWTTTTGKGSISVNYTSTGGCLSTKTSKTVTLKRGVYITDQPAAYQSLCSGEPLLLTVRASDTAISYQWYHNDLPIQGAVGSVYSVDQSKISDSGNYYVSVSNDCNTTYSDTVYVSVGIMDIVVQKWDNVLAVNCLPEENGGYQFQRFQWYKNGELLQEETKSYLHVASSNIDYSALYAVSATTVTGETYFTCAQTFVLKNSLSIRVYPNPVQAGQQIQVITDLDNNENPEIEYILSNSMGQTIFRQKISGKRTTLNMPGVSGVYLLRVNSGSGNSKGFKIIVKE